MPSTRKDKARVPPLTVSRPELLRNGSDRQYRRLVHGLFAFLARHEAVRTGHGSFVGLFGIEYTVLISIAHLSSEEADISVNRIAQHLHVSGAFVTNVTNRLMARGLVGKLADESDRRRVRLQVTSAGFELLAKLAPVQRQVNDVQWDLRAGELEVLIDIVERLIKSSDRALQIQQYLLSESDTQSVRETRAAKTSPTPARSKPKQRGTARP